MRKIEEAEQYFGLVAPYLAKNGIRNDIIRNMTLSGTKAGNIRVSPKGLNDLVLVRRGTDLSPAGGIFPEEWLGVPMEDVDAGRLLQAHPQRDLIKSVSCIKYRSGLGISIIPAEGIPYKLTEFIKARDVPAAGIYGWFPGIDLISEPGPELLDEAASLFEGTFQGLCEKYGTLDIPAGIRARKKLSCLSMDACGRIRTRLSYKYEDSAFTFSWEGFSVCYDTASSSFSGVKEPYSKCLEAIGKSQKALLEAERLCGKINGSKCGAKASFDLSLSPLRAVVSVAFHNSSSRYYITNRAFRKDSEAASRDFETDLAADRETDRKLKEKYEQRMKESMACGSLLADCIIDTVRVNTDRYKGIPLTQLVKKVRGLATTFYDGGKDAGRFRLIPDQEVAEMARELQGQGIIGCRKVSGEFTDYEKFFLADTQKASFITNLSSPASGTSDKEWLEEIQAPSGMLGWKDKLEILDHPTVYCVDSTAYIRYFSDAPETVLSYVKMVAKMGDGTKKKLCKLILDQLKTKPSPKKR